MTGTVTTLMLGRLKRNSAVLLGGNFVIAALSIATFSLNARALGAEELGVLMLLIAIGTVIHQIADFDAWQAVIIKGSSALKDANKTLLAHLILVGLAFDAIACFSAALFSVVLVVFAGNVAGIPYEYMGAAAFYMSMIVFRISGTPIGVLRLFDRFSLAALFAVVEVLGQMLVALVLFALNAHLTWYICLYAIVSAGVNTSRLAVALRTAASHGVAIHLSDLGTAWTSVIREMWTFSWRTNLTITMRALRMNGGPILLGSLVGPAAVALYTLAARLTTMLSQVSTPILQALLPEMARMIADREHTAARRLVGQVSLVCGLMGAVAIGGAILFGDIAIKIIAGTGFQSAYSTLVVLTIAQSIIVLGVGIQPAVLSIVGPGAILAAEVAAVVIFGAVAPVAILTNGIEGMAMAQVMLSLSWLGVMTVAYFWMSGTSAA